MGNYWQDRFVLLEKMQMNRGIEYYHELEKQYTKAAQEVEKEISYWYSRLANNNQITMSEAKKLLSDDELKEFKWTVEEYIEKGRENNIDGRWMKELENASARVHINRLDAMKIQMQQQVEMLYGNELDSFDEFMRDTYTKGFYRSAFEIQRGLGVGTNLAKLDTDKINKVLSKPWAADGSNFSSRIWKQKNQLVNELHNGLTQAFIRGTDSYELTKLISNRFKVSKGQAGRLVMTETAYFHSAAQIDSFKELGVKEYEITAVLDSHTSEICRDMDGKHLPISEFKAGITAPPFHCWCRSTTVPYFNDEFTAEETRIARGNDGKLYEVPYNMTYRQWEKQFVKSGSIANIRDFVDVKLDISVSGYKTISSGYSIQSNGEKYGQKLSIITLDKRNTTEWNEFPIGTKEQLKYSMLENKPFYLSKGDYEVQRYVEGSFENEKRDEIAKAIGGDYLGFAFQNKNGYPLFIDFYKKGDELLYSIGKADVKKVISEDAIKEVRKIVQEREQLIIEQIGDDNLKHITSRKGDEWVASMKEFHRSIQADEKPVILSDKEYDEIAQPILYRGIAPQSHLRKDITTTSTTTEMADEFFKGDSPFPSRGVYGDGVAYASPSYKKIALNYATGGGKQLHGGVIIEFKLKSDAKIIEYEDALDIFQQLSQIGDNKLLFNPNQNNAYDKEVGKAMNALGYDAILKHNGDNTGKDFYTILNRGALVTKEKYVTTRL